VRHVAVACGGQKSSGYPEAARRVVALT